MSEPGLPIPSLPPGSALAVVLSFLGVCLVAVLRWSGVRGSQTAQQQSTLNDAMHSLIEDLQKERSALSARVSEAEQQLALERDCHGDTRRDLLEERAKTRGLEQMNLSLQHSLQRLEAGHGLPGSSADDGEGI